MDSTSFIIANPRHVPLFKYNSDVDNSGVWVVYHSKGYLRRKRKMRFKKNLERELDKQNKQVNVSA
jgi:hypothetical protein